ncbi:MAG: hypothetical protein HKO90_05415 [Flavobacteriaceae bacterium]|nr:hypothetical protein [Flavobacteriaceae bacterium]
MYSVRTILAIAIGLAAILFIILGLSECIFNSAYVPPDTSTYIEASNMLFADFKPHPLRPVGYALLLGLPNLFMDNVGDRQYITFGILLNLFCWLASIVILYKIFLNWFKTKVAFWLTLFWVFSLGTVAQNFLALTDSVAVFMLMLLSLYLVKYQGSGKMKYMIISVSLLNLLVLIKPGFLYLAILSTLTLVVFLIKKQKFHSGVWLLLMSVTLIGVQYVMMYNSYEKVKVSFIDKVTWYRYLGAESYAKVSHLEYLEVRETRTAELAGRSYKQIDELSSDDMKHQLRENPTAVLSSMAENLFSNSIAGSYGILAVQNILPPDKTFYLAASRLLFTLSRLQNMAFVLLYLVSLILVLRKIRRVDPSTLFLQLLASYVILTSTVSFRQGDRFHLVIYPIILIIFLYLVKHKSWVRVWLK